MKDKPFKGKPIFTKVVRCNEKEEKRILKLLPAIQKRWAEATKEWLRKMRGK